MVAGSDEDGAQWPAALTRPAIPCVGLIRVSPRAHILAPLPDDASECSSFETLVAQQSAPGVPISATFGESIPGGGVPGVDATPLQSSVLGEPMSTLDAGVAASRVTSMDAKVPTTGKAASVDSSTCTDTRERSASRHENMLATTGEAGMHPLLPGPRLPTVGLAAAAAVPLKEEQMPSGTVSIG